MKTLNILLLLLISNLVTANDSITTMSDYTQHAVIELAASPPLKLLANIKGESRHEVTLGHLKTSIDGDSTMSTGAKRTEEGSADGFGIGYGYSRSFADKWAFFSWFQFVTQSGEHTQRENGITTTRIDAFDSKSFNISLGLSYEFLRDKDKHILNTFAGVSLIHLELTGQIQNSNATNGNPETNYIGSLDGFQPAVLLGTMYSYKAFELVEIVPYAIGIISLAEECQTFRVDDVKLTDGNIRDNSPKCGVNTTDGDGETDIQTSVLTVGFRINYIPWDLGFNISGVLRDAILRDEEEDRAPVSGAFLSITKTL